MSTQPRRVLFPGSFDPFTKGHANLVERGLQLFDHVVIAVGYNEQKQGWIPVQKRVEALKALYAGDSRVTVESYSCLTADFAKQCGATAILRGIRSVKDYEYEAQMADVNRQLSGIETILLFADPQLSAVSSSIVRELAHFGKDIKPFLPEGLHYTDKK
ncbi:MAG: pantetheine-phosphate adenylyltransferase [Bacteroidaceae bacterium]|nr:pantetheine-phosphate adenylyltransferase [Bacteroidaceae bacterium]